MTLFDSIRPAWGRAALAAILMIFPFSATAGAEQGDITYVVDETIELDHLGGGGWPTAINEKGQIVGQSAYRGDGLWHAARWEGEGVEDLLLGIPGYRSIATDINNFGEIVGRISTRHDPEDPDFVWYQAFHFYNGAFTNLSDIIPKTSSGREIPSYAAAINDQGVIVGATWQTEKPGKSGQSAIRWYAHDYPNYAFFEAQNESFSRYSIGTDVNEQDIAVGFRRESHDPSQTHSRFFNTGNGQNHELAEWRDDLFETTCYWELGNRGLSINDNNWIVGATNDNGTCRAVRFQSQGPPMLLNSVGAEDTESRAFDVNNHNMIVGHVGFVPCRLARER